MVVSPLSMPVVAGAVPGVMARVNTRFKETFEKITNPEGYTARRKEAEEAAAGAVSQALILPILKQIRRSPFNQAGPFSPGIGEKTFGTQFDMAIADRIAQSPRLGIKEALADRLMKRGQADTKMKLDVRG
jgi:hypothetical protein